LSDLAAEVRVERQPHLAHSANAERTRQLVLVEPCAGLDGHVRAG
jgi:hypothetical protein